MKSKTRTILRPKPKALGGKTRTGQKAVTYSLRGSNSPPARGLSDTLGESSKAVLAPLRTSIPGGVKQDLEEIVTRLGLYASVSELTRSVLLKERDKRIGELRRARKEAEQSR